MTSQETEEENPTENGWEMEGEIRKVVLKG